MRSRMCTWWHDEAVRGTCFPTPNSQCQAQLCVQEYGFLRLGSAQTRPLGKTTDVGGGTFRTGFLSETSAHDFPHTGQGDPFQQKTRISFHAAHPTGPTTTAFIKFAVR